MQGPKERVFIIPIFIVKSIPLKCHLTFSQTLKYALFKVVAKSGYVGVWIWLLLPPSCILHVVKYQNRRDRKYENWKALQQHHILECLIIWRDVDVLAKLVDSMLRVTPQLII